MSVKTHKTRGRAGGASRAVLYGLIDLNCKYCIYDKGCEGSWRRQVEECTESGCGLYPVRPVRYERGG